MCIKHFCQMVLIPVLYYCQHTVILLLYMFMMATLDVTLVWYLHFCLGLETFPVCWLRHWPNTGSTDPKQIADSLHGLKNTHTFQTWGTKCSFKHTAKKEMLICLQQLVCDHFKSNAHDPSSQVGYVLSSAQFNQKVYSDCFIWIILEGWRGETIPYFMRKQDIASHASSFVMYWGTDLMLTSECTHAHSSQVMFTVVAIIV